MEIVLAVGGSLQGHLFATWDRSLDTTRDRGLV